MAAATALAAWLDARSESPYAFSIRLGMNQQTIYALCGVPSSRPPAGFKTPTLERIAAETGIPVARLYGDWAGMERKAG